MTSEPFHKILGAETDEPRTHLGDDRQLAADWLTREIGKIAASGCDWAAEVEVETVELEAPDEYGNRFAVTPRMRMVIEWVQPEAVPA